MDFYKNKKILVTGGTGMIGRHLVDLLKEKSAVIRIASLDDPVNSPSGVEYFQSDLTQKVQALTACEGMDYVFQLACVKGSPKSVKENPATFFDGNLLVNIQMLRAAHQQNVERYLFTSSLAVYSPAELFHEDSVWKTFPSPNDTFAGWAKRMGELQVEAYRKQYGWNTIQIVRPGNTYGPFDCFDEENSMVIPSLIRKAVNKEDPLVVWGDGTQKRDFIHARDVALGMILTMEKGIAAPINLGSGNPYMLRDVVNIIISNVGYSPKVIYDSSQPSGDPVRVLDISRARSFGFNPQISLEDGISQTIKWYQESILRKFK